MKFKKEDMVELVCSGKPEGFMLIRDEIFDTSRWSVIHGVIFKHEGKYYSSHYSRGSTEYKDESPYEYDGDEIECEEVEPREVTTVQYFPIGSK